MNAVLLRINLTCMIVSPIVAGQLMTSFGMTTGLAFIAAWNLVSYVAEYWLLWIVYNAVGDLSLPKITKEKEGEGFILV